MYFYFLFEINIFNKLFRFAWHDIAFLCWNCNQPTLLYEESHFLCSGCDCSLLLRKNSHFFIRRNHRLATETGVSMYRRRSMKVTCIQISTRWMCLLEAVHILFVITWWDRWYRCLHTSRRYRLSPDLMCLGRTVAVSVWRQPNAVARCHRMNIHQAVSARWPRSSEVLRRRTVDRCLGRRRAEAVRYLQAMKNILWCCRPKSRTISRRRRSLLAVHRCQQGLKLAACRGTAAPRFHRRQPATPADHLLCL